MEDQDMRFEVIDGQGRKVACEVLFTFQSKETGKNYIVYTDNSEDDEGNTRVFASTYNPDEDATKLFPVETEKEWRIIETILDELQNDASDDEE